MNISNYLVVTCTVMMVLHLILYVPLQTWNRVRVCTVQESMNSMTFGIKGRIRVFGLGCHTPEKTSTRSKERLESRSAFSLGVFALVLHQLVLMEPRRQIGIKAGREPEGMDLCRENVLAESWFAGASLQTTPGKARDLLTRRLCLRSFCLDAPPKRKAPRFASIQGGHDFFYCYLAGLVSEERILDENGMS